MLSCAAGRVDVKPCLIQSTNLGLQSVVPLHRYWRCRAGCRSLRQPCRNCSRPPPRHSPRHSCSAHPRGRQSAGARSRRRRRKSSHIGRLWRRWRPEQRWWLRWRTSLCNTAAGPATLLRDRVCLRRHSCTLLDDMACSHHRTFDIDSDSLTAGLAGTATA